MRTSPFIGQMDRKIKIVAKVIDRDSTGGEDFTENVICEPFACLNEQNGNESAEGKVIHLIDRSYTIRYRSDVKDVATQLIVIDGDQQYDVYHVRELGRKKHLELLVKGYE